MSSPRYTSAESTLTISPPRRRAQSRASALLPEAVGPINAIAGGRGSCMACQPARMGVRTSGTSVAGFAQRSPHLLVDGLDRSEEHTSELQSLMRSSYTVFCMKKKSNRENAQLHSIAVRHEQKEKTL